MRRTRHSSRTPTARVRFALGLWAASVAGGLIALNVYSATPGSTAENTATWPSDAGLTRTDGRPVLVVTLHPRCPCSRATVSELNKLMTRLVDRLDVYVLFVHDAEDSSWVDSDLYVAAGRIPGVQTRGDRAGRISARLRASTSGSALLFDGRGEHRFSGGLTPGRGHEGDSVGAQQIVRLVEGEAPRAARSAVYGCELAEEAP